MRKARNTKWMIWMVCFWTFAGFAQDEPSEPNMSAPPSEPPAQAPVQLPPPAPIPTSEKALPTSESVSEGGLETISPSETDAPAAASDEDTEGAPAQASSGEVAKGALPETYSIQSGDTLWDICSKLLDNPWYWPKLWSLNEYITNPHLIYPGQKVFFFSGSETAPPRMDLVAEKAPPEEQPEPESEAPAPKRASRVEFGDTLYGIGAVPLKVKVKLKPVVFISENELKRAGKITHSGEPKMNLVFGDNVYMQLKNKNRIAVGDEFQVIEIIKEVDDPNSAFGTLGYLVKRKAVIRVKCLYPDTVEGLIVDGEDSVSRGEYVIPYTNPVRTVTPNDNCNKAKGLIVAADHEQYLISNQDFVFLNLGKKDGIKDGNWLSVVRRGDGLNPSDDEGLPDVIFGKLLVVETTDHTSTAYVTDLKDSLEIGDRVICPAPSCQPDSRNRVSCR